MNAARREGGDGDGFIEKAFRLFIISFDRLFVCSFISLFIRLLVCLFARSFDRLSHKETERASGSAKGAKGRRELASCSGGFENGEGKRKGRRGTYKEENSDMRRKKINLID